MTDRPQDRRFWLWRFWYDMPMFLRIFIILAVAWFVGNRMGIDVVGGVIYLVRALFELATGTRT